MRLTQLTARGNDPVVIEFKDRVRVLFSYEAPVAAFVPGRGFLVADGECTTATYGRIGKWIGNKPFEKVPHSEIQNLVVGRPLRTED